MLHEETIDDSPVRLAAGDLTVELVPDIGGSVASFRLYRGAAEVDLMRPLSEAARRKRDPVGAAMFPMLPYANRIADNRFEFDGHTYKLAPNAAGQRFNLPGTGWTSTWKVATTHPGAAELTLEHLRPSEPYCYFAYQRFNLAPDRLRVEMGITNRGTRPMPFGLGLHPWWDHGTDVSLKFRSTHFWLESPEHLATDRIATPPELDFSQGLALPKTWRNNCYSGWDGAAEILFSGLDVGMRIEADAIFGHLMLYFDPTRSDFCLEPQTHATGALNRISRSDARQNDADRLGLQILAPQESVAGAVTFIPFELESAP